MMDSSGGSSDIVGLNVGGIIYKTSTATLMKYHESFFSKMLESHVTFPKDDEGNFYIDRNGQIFRHVLFFMRNGMMRLPDDFKEYTLLEHEAEVYSLLELVKVVQEAVSFQEVSFAFDNHGEMCSSEMLFRVTRKALLREDNSLFSKIVRGEAVLPRDSQGNLIMRRDGSLFKHVHDYLEKGAFFSDLEVPIMESLLKEAVHYSLEVLQHQIKSILAMRNNFVKTKGLVLDTPELRLQMYWWVNGPCVMFANKPSGGKNKVWNIAELCKEDVTICGSVFAGIIDKEKTIPAPENNFDDILKVIAHKALGDVMAYDLNPRLTICKNCTKAIMNEYDNSHPSLRYFSRLDAV